MPRTPRLDHPGARHHVMNRCASRRRVFTKAEDLARFQDILAEVPGRFDARVHAWALLSSHFHLLVEVNRGNLSDLMRFVGSELARRTNLDRGWDGPLLRGRYRNRAVLDDEYWRHLLVYLHLNPVQAGLVAHPDDSRWTSHRAYLGLDPEPPWLSTDELLELYGGREILSRVMAEHLAGTLDLPDDFLDERLWRPANTAVERLTRLQPAVRTLSIEEALQQIAQALGTEAEALRRPVRGRGGNPGRKLAAWWLLRATASSREHIGQELGMSPNAVGQAAHRVRREEDSELARLRDGLLEAWLAPLGGALGKNRN